MLAVGDGFYSSPTANNFFNFKPVTAIPKAPAFFYLTLNRTHGRMSIALGVRLVVGQQTLDLYAEVRILHPQPGFVAAFPFPSQAPQRKIFGAPARYQAFWVMNVIFLTRE